MIRRTVAVTAWLVTAAMDALAAWTLIDGTYLQSILASMPPDQRVVAAGTLGLIYAVMAAIIAVSLAYATVGLLLASRRGGGRVGAFLLAGGVGFTAVPFGYLVGGLLVLRDPLDPVANLVFLVGPTSEALGYTLILPILALVFPDGRLPSRRWRWPVGVAIAGLVSATILTALTPGEIAGTVSRNPLGVDAIPTWLSGLPTALSSIGIVLTSVLAIASVITRYRRGSTLERLQLRWFIAAVLLAVVPLTIAPIPGLGGPVWVALAAFGLLLVPVSVWIAVTRHRLYDIDRILSRTVSYGALTGILAVVFVGTILVSQTVLASFFSGNSVAVAASTLVVAALFQPLRRRVQSVVDRRFNRSRYDAERTVAAFAEELRNEVDLARLQAALVATAVDAVRPVSATVWLRAGGEVGR